LTEIVRLIEHEEIWFEKEENEWVTVKAGRSTFRMAGVARDQFPEVPQFKSVPMKLPAEMFQRMIHQTAFAITNEQSRFTLSGAKFVLTEQAARMVTTDGHRLAFIEKVFGEEIKVEGAMDALIPKKALLELARISKGAKGDVAFGEDQNHLYFEIGGRLLITRKLSGNFPNYEMVMPKDNDKAAILELDAIRGAIRRVRLMADERTQSMKLTFGDGALTVAATSSEEGSGSEVVDTDYQGEEVTLGFNGQYLQDFLAVVVEGIADLETTLPEQKEGEEPVKMQAVRPRIQFEFKDSDAQTQIRLADEKAYDFRYIVMPLRL
jgi:DNA polymerase-3 subunit beta